MYVDDVWVRAQVIDEGTKKLKGAFPHLATSGQSEKLCCRVRLREDFTMSPAIWTTANFVAPTLMEPWTDAWSVGVIVLVRDLVRKEAFKEWFSW